MKSRAPLPCWCAAVVVVAAAACVPFGLEVASGENVVKRIIGGKPAPADKFPWAVTIRGVYPKGNGAFTVCGATIINQKWLLTAAHCFWTKGPNGEEKDLRNTALWHILGGQVFIQFDQQQRGHAVENAKVEKSVAQDEFIEIEEEEDDIDAERNGKFKINRKKVKIYRGEVPPKALLREKTPSSKANTARKEEGVKVKAAPKPAPPKPAPSKPKSSSRRRPKRMVKRSSSLQHVHIDQILLHPKYIWKTLEYDIALLKLSQPMALEKFTAIAAVPLPPVRVTAGVQQLPTDADNCILVGWGCTTRGGQPTEKAQYTNLTVMSHSACKQAYGGSLPSLNADHEFCAGFVKQNIGICPGDSGGGLVCPTGADNTLYVAGVTSATHKAQPESHPGLFTRVSYFTDWIVSATKEE